MIRSLFPILLIGCIPKPTADADTEPAKNFVELTAPGTEPIEVLSETQTRDVLITGATVWTAAGERYSPGWIHFSEGDIVALGDGSPHASPSGET